MTTSHQENASTLQVRISFELSRFSAEILARAYEQIVPIVCRPTVAVNAKTQGHSPPIPPAAGELSG